MRAEGPGGVDERVVRAGQSVIAVLLLAGFVFQWPWLVPLAGAVVGIGALWGPSANPLWVAMTRALGSRLGAPQEVVPVPDARALDVLAAGLLGFATLCLIVGAQPLGWLLALLEAGVAAIAASTGFNAATALQERLHKGS